MPASSPYIDETLPRDGGVLVGRVWMPRAKGGGHPVVVSILDGHVYDISKRFDTIARLLNGASPATAAKPDTRLDQDMGTLDRFLKGPVGAAKTDHIPHLMAPCDLQPVKASGVTFLISLKERVIEEAAKGDPRRAAELRHTISDELDRRLTDVKPGSPQAAAAKVWLTENNLWSQYLEVAIGPDAEIFTKAPPLSAVGTGSNIGILRSSQWNNPEPEVVLAINSAGDIVGATLGNDVNLRDIEGRSGLLLGKAKDNNASCAIGPFIRLFEGDFGIDDIRHAEISLDILGADGFTLAGVSRMEQISRDPQELVRQAIGPHHQYPDGLMLFLGTMFSPSKDRGEAGRGFTHHAGDIVAIRSPRLGSLVNRVDYCDAIEPWTFGISQLIDTLLEQAG